MPGVACDGVDGLLKQTCFLLLAFIARSVWDAVGHSHVGFENEEDTYGSIMNQNEVWVIPKTGYYAYSVSDWFLCGAANFFRPTRLKKKSAPMLLVWS